MGIIRELGLNNFRNYQNSVVQLNDGICVLVGKNGQGKTSFLEAINFLSVLRSFRCQQLKNLVSWSHKVFKLKSVIEGQSLTTRLEIHSGEKRKLFLNGIPVYRATEFIGKICCIPFISDDIKLVRGMGSDRRRFLDTTLSQLFPGYLTVLRDYQKALQSRNSLLRNETLDTKSLEAFDSILIKCGALICHHRYRFFFIIAGNS